MKKQLHECEKRDQKYHWVSNEKTHCNKALEVLTFNRPKKNVLKQFFSKFHFICI